MILFCRDMSPLTRYRVGILMNIFAFVIYKYKCVKIPNFRTQGAITDNLKPEIKSPG